MPQQKASAGGNPHSPPLNFLSPAADRQKLSGFSSNKLFPKIKNVF